MRYSTEPRDRVYVKEYRFLSVAKNLSNKYSQKLIDAAFKNRIKKSNSKNSRSNR